MLVFEEWGKLEYPGKNLSEQSREPTNSTHIRRRIRESIPGHIGGRRVLSPLRQPCSPLIFQVQAFFYSNSKIVFLRKFLPPPPPRDKFHNGRVLGRRRGAFWIPNQFHVNDEMIYEMYHIWSYDPRSYKRIFCNCVEKSEKFRTSTGFGPVTSRYRCDALTN